MGKHTKGGWSTVASKWRKAYETCNVGDNFSKVKLLAGNPDEELNLGDTIIYNYISEEWKGFLRGGTITRKMTFIVKDGIIISKSGQNLDRIAG